MMNLNDLNNLIPGRKDKSNTIDSIYDNIEALKSKIDDIQREMNDDAKVIWIRIASICEHNFYFFSSSHNRNINVCSKCGLREDDYYNPLGENCWNYTPDFIFTQNRCITKHNIRKIKIDKILKQK